MSQPARRLLDDCFLHDKDRMRHDDALALLKERVSVVAGEEWVTLDQAHERVLCEAVVAPRNIPAFDNAAVDGYALRAEDLAADGETVLPVTLRIPAGHPSPLALRPGGAARIFTGAVMPEGADTVVMQEDIVLSAEGGSDRVCIPAGVRAGINRRRAGEDVAVGDTMLDPGLVLRPQDLAAAASSGAGRLKCYKPLRVALISTGDEIIRPGTPFAEGQVYDANHYLLSSLLSSTGAVVTDYGILADDADTVRSALEDAAARHDVVMTSGGASRGEEDHVVELVNRIGKLHAWQLAVKPGRPLAFGQIGDTVFLGLPGNPVAVMVCFLLYARPMLSRLQGSVVASPQRFAMKAGFEIARKKTDRREFLRGWIDDRDSQGPVVKKFDRDGSGLISSLTRASGLIELPEDVSSVAMGDDVAYIPFSEFGLNPR